jgi:hypothetical protein
LYEAVERGEDRPYAYYTKVQRHYELIQYLKVKNTVKGAQRTKMRISIFLLSLVAVLVLLLVLEFMVIGVAHPLLGQEPEISNTTKILTW